MSHAPEPVAVLVASEEHATLYEDGEHVIAGEGDAYCSEHGNIAHDDIAAEQCDHENAFDEAGRATVPAFAMGDLASLALNDRDVRRAAAERPDIIERVAEQMDAV